MRNQKGITLVALVVTIVVLLILAGTSIAMLSGDNGIITNAQKSKAANTEGEVVDKVKMAFNTIKTDVIVKSSIDPEYSSKDATIALGLAQTIVDELGLTGTIAAGTPVEGNGYTVEYDATAFTITVTYTDSLFKTGADYGEIEMIITIEDNKVKLDEYEMQTFKD